MMKTLRIDRKELRTILSLILVLALVMTPMAMPVYGAHYAVYYVAGDVTNGVAPEPMETCTEGAIVTVEGPGNLEKDGHSFAGWALSGVTGHETAYDGEESEGVNYKDIYQPGEEFKYNGQPAKLTAQWTPNLYTVDFEMHGHGTAPADQNVTYGAIIPTEPEDFEAGVTTVDGYTFRGWFTVEGNNWLGWTFASDTVSGNTTLHAAWECTVAYDANNADATGGPVESETTYIGKSVTVKDEGAFEDTDAVTVGWATTSDATRAVYTHGDNFTPDANTTLYAFWAPTCLVTYAAGEGSGTKTDTTGIDNSNRHKIGYTVELPSAEGLTAPEGKKFIGWTVNTGTALYEEGDEITLTGDTTITAQWAEAWTITYTNGGGTGTLPAAKNVASGSSITLASGNDLHQSETLIFKNWKVEGENVYYEAGETITPESNLTLVAQYDTKYTVTFENNGAGAQPADVILAGEGAVPWKSSYNLVPETANLEFLGWYTDKHFEDESRFIFKNDPEYTSVSPTAVTADLTLYAKWSGGIPYYTNFVEITDISSFVSGETYLFAYCTPVAIDAKVIDMPSGSARLTFTGTDPASLEAAVETYRGRTPGEMRHTISSFDGYVKTEQQGQGFDGCPGGSIYRAADAWWYNCCRGGVFSVGPFHTYVYDTYMTGAVTISFRADSQYVYKKGGEPPTHDDFIAEADLGADNGGIVEIHDFKIEKFDNTGDLGIVYVTIGDYTKRFELTGTKHNKNNTQTVVATVSGGQSSSGIGANLSGNNATIDKLTNAQVKAVAGEKGSDVRIDISGVDKSVNQITIPAQTVESVANTVNEGNGNKSLTLALPNATVTLDNDAFNAIKDQAEGDLKLVVDQPKQSTLQSAQRTALSEKDVKIVVDAYFVSGGKRLGNFKGGKVTVAIPYTPKADEDTSKLQAYYIDNSGNMTAYPTTWKDGNTYFDVDHFSHFVVLYEGAAEEEVPVDTSAFIDLKAGAWYMDAVKYCLENGYMKGINSTYFGGLLNTTRAEVATIIWRMEGCPAPAAAAKFTDIPQGKWYSDSVAWGTENGVLLGISDTEFAPDATITREQLTAMFYRYSNLKNKAAGNDGTALAKFKDASNVTAYAVDSMKWATSEGLVNGIGGNLLVPRDFTTRFQLATMIWKYRSL